MQQAQDRTDLLQDLISRAKKAGADAADALMVESTSFGASYRLGNLEDIERSETQDLGLRVMVGQKQAVVSTTDVGPRAFDSLVERVIAMAKVAPEDPYCGLADPALLATEIADLELDDGSDPTAEELVARAQAAEEAALAVDGVTNSGGAGSSFGRAAVTLVTSDGFAGHYGGSTHSVSCSVLAGEGTEMERDYDYSTARHFSDLEDPTKIGREAGEKAVRRLGARKVESCQVPIIYDPRVSGGLVGHFAGAISGASVARGTSFLKGSLDTQLFAKGIRITDDPLKKRGRGSKPFDGEGVRTEALTLIDDGRLTTWLLDTSTGKQLGLASNGRAARGTGGSPSPSTTNLTLEAGSLSPEELMADITSGFYVTEMIGMGVNGVTGDYSRGASGFWIENGELTFPVSEITIAGNLKDMFANLTPASDLEFKAATNAPTVRIEGMTLAGT
ncbi:metallopeptidase TldD-related protein [Parvibaculaceae bacterium PLY_AMNH_Bact1]|nr:metallopeptidase TldD-related protein [Parvibaculaceae bacterium PLY_AMNH_Bact1]